MTNKNDYSDILIEGFNSKFDAILEAVGSMKHDVKRIPGIEEKVDGLRREMRTVKLATTDTNRDMKDVKAHIEKVDNQLIELEKRVAAIESA